ncbi:MAG: hypothetical protein IJS14_04045 [Lentisphaeria bacterium]|nr:hypothetical protein [Lentisphaeria bacterium]
MRSRYYNRYRTGLSDGTDSRRLLAMSLQEGNSRKQGLPNLDGGIRKRRMILYGIAGALFCAGLLFVLF